MIFEKLLNQLKLAKDLIIYIHKTTKVFMIDKN